MKSRDDLELEAQEQIEASLKKGEIDQDAAEEAEAEIKKHVEVRKDGVQMLVHLSTVAHHVKAGWKAPEDWVPGDADLELLGKKK